MKLGFQALAISTLLLTCNGWAAASTLQPDAAAFVAEMVAKHKFDANELTGLLAEAKHRQDIIDAVSRPAEGKPWSKYRPIFLTESRIEGGLEFWDRHEELLEAVEKKYGVPPEIIVAIIGVETRYGANTGKYPVLDSLSTLAFGYPKRGKFFRRELEQFLLLTREEEVAPVGVKGSYAGAMGKPQFIASSYRAYAIDYDGDGRRDLWNSPADVLGSVANYFSKHGWRPGEPVTFPGTVTATPDARFAEAGMKPSIRVAELQAAGVEAVEDLPPDTLVSLVELDGAESKEYWLGLHNFYVITRYNHSNLYAMAVYQLAQEILALRQARKANSLAAR